MLSFFPRGVLDDILNLIESVSEDFLPTVLEKQQQDLSQGQDSSPDSALPIT